MKKLLFSLSSLLIVTFFACNNSGDNNEPVISSEDSLLTQKADNLEKEVLEGHDIAMPKSMKIPALQKEVKRMIDSVGKLPARAQEAAAPYKAKLETLLKDLDYADMAMNKWMEEFRLDSARTNLEQRIRYLADEKIKVDKVKEAVLGSLAKADSLLKAKL